jgi:hypothetical protein
VCVSKVYVTFCGAAANWGVEWLFVGVHRSHTQLDTHIHTRYDSEWVTGWSHRPLLIHNTKQNKEMKFRVHIWIQTGNPTKETEADLHIKPIRYRDRRSQYGIFSLHLWWLTNVIKCSDVEIVERHKELHKETFWIQSTEITQ